ncbi:MAG: hypothetical protein COT73_12470 [Bdellovibrio sp. CG10_big_fil_rev_8_21_14_0_10_47_8]|nr:MAG: hypothetical protein COT73_12470 [Bdellovibrio sp. CG10_big_fil_rev_8_21_14_0_10_47_8]
MIKERSLFANTAWGVIANLLRAVISLAFIPFVIQRLGAIGYGLYAILMLFTFYQGFLGRIELGYSGFLVKYLSRFVGENSATEFEKKTAGFLPSMIFFQTIIWGCFWQFRDNVLGWLKIPLEHSSEFSTAVLIIFLANLFSATSSLYIAYLTSQHRNVFLKKTDAFFFFVFNALSLGFLIFEPSLLSLAFAFLISQALNCLTLIVVCRNVHFGKLIFSRFRVADYKENWHHWRPFFYANLNGLAFRQADTALISFILGPQAVAAYDICMKIPSFIKSSLSKVSEVLVPFSSSRSQVSKDQFLPQLLYKIVFLTGAVALGLVICVGFYGDSILRAWIGEDFAYLHRGFLIACFVPFFVAFCSSPAAVFLGRDNRMSLMTWGPTLISVVNLVISVPMTMYWGFEGTILATVIQYLLYAAMLVKPLKDDFGLSVASMLPGLTISASVVAAAYWIFYPVLNLKLARLEWLTVFVLIHGVLGLIFYGLHRKMIRELRALMVHKASKLI